MGTHGPLTGLQVFESEVPHGPCAGTQSPGCPRAPSQAGAEARNLAGPKETQQHAGSNGTNHLIPSPLFSSPVCQCALLQGGAAFERTASGCRSQTWSLCGWEE